MPESKKILENLITLSLLLFIIYLAISIRLSTLDSPTVLDYDPWWNYRLALDIMNNNFVKPKWDYLSFYPPGRPTEKYLGWEYTMIIFHKIISLFVSISFMETAKWSPAIMAGLTAIPAFLLGRFLVNKWAGLTTALFATLTPTFMGVSMAGYCDTDVVVVFYSFLSIYSIFLALKKKSIPYYAFAIITCLVYVYSWGAGWLTLIFFTFFLPVLFLFRILEELIHQKRLKIDISNMLQEAKSLFTPLLIILLITNLLGYFVFNLSNMVFALFRGLAFTGIAGTPQLVNISVAELQVINVFTKSGFEAVRAKVGLGPTLLTFFGLPLLVLYKIYKKERIAFAEVFLFLWALAMFYLISRGVRFSLLFSAATAASAGYVIGNTFKYVKNRLFAATAFGFIMLLILMFISTAIQSSYGLRGMEISKNWYEMLDWLKANADKDALVATWWDPGHIIAGYTGLKVHADGAHCGFCVPWPHNTRIQDMGRIMTTDDENESVAILQKYIELTPEQRQEVIENFGDLVPEDAFKPVTEIYLIASADLIGKYYWMSYFGSCLKQYGLENAESCYATGPGWFRENAQGRNYVQLPFSNYDPTQGVITYGGGGVQLLLARKEDKWVPLLNVPQQGIRNIVVREIVYYENGVQRRVSYENVSNAIDGLVWVDSGYGMAIFMEPEIRDSVFTRLFFFNGEGLKHFELVLSNPEIKLYRVKF